MPEVEKIDLDRQRRELEALAERKRQLDRDNRALLNSANALNHFRNEVIEECINEIREYSEYETVAMHNFALELIEILSNLKE
jgi:hypothetical protein